MKILVGFSQILVSFKDAFRLDNPPEVDEFLEKVSVLAFDLVTFIRPGCMWTPDFIVKMEVMAVGPLALVLLGFAVEKAQEVWLNLRHRNKKSGGNSNAAPQPKKFAVLLFCTVSFAVQEVLS